MGGTSPPATSASVSTAMAPGLVDAGLFSGGQDASGTKSNEPWPIRGREGLVDNMPDMFAARDSLVHLRTFCKLSCQTTQSAALHVLIASLQVPLELVLRRILAAAGSGNRRQKRAGNEAGARSHTTLSPLAPLHSVAPPILLAAHVLHQR